MFTTDEELIRHKNDIITLIGELLQQKTPRAREFVIKENKISILYDAFFSIIDFLRLPKEDRCYETISQQLSGMEVALVRANDVTEEELAGLEDDEPDEEM
jgi:phosphoglycerate-specific signal transduction histidine kinase